MQHQHLQGKFSVPQKDSHSHSRSQAQARYITNYTKGHK